MSTSVVILNILFHVWLNGSSVDITEDMQRIIAWLFCSDPEVHNCKRVFLLIPYEMQRLCLDSLKAFSLLEERLLKSIISCCIRSFDKFFLRKTGEVLTMFYESRHMQGGLLSFFFLLLSEYEDYMGSCSFRIRDLYTTLQPLVDATLPALSKDTCIGVALPNLLPDVISRSSRVMNVHTQNAVLRLVSQTDASLASYSDELVAVVSQFIFNHLIKVAHLTKDRSVVQDHFFTPCFAILSSNTEAFGLILDAILDYVGPSLCLKDGAAVAAVMASIFRNDAMRAALPPFEDRIARITSELVTLKSTTSNELDNMPVKKFYNLCRSLQQLI